MLTSCSITNIAIEIEWFILPSLIAVLFVIATYRLRETAVSIFLCFQPYIDTNLLTAYWLQLFFAIKFRGLGIESPHTIIYFQTYYVKRFIKLLFSKAKLIENYDSLHNTLSSISTWKLIWEFAIYCFFICERQISTRPNDLMHDYLFPILCKHLFPYPLFVVGIFENQMNSWSPVTSYIVACFQYLYNNCLI